MVDDSDTMKFYMRDLDASASLRDVLETLAWLNAKRTQGTWHHCSYAHVTISAPLRSYGDQRIIAECGDERRDKDEGINNDTGVYHADIDAQFIALAANAMPRLLELAAKALVSIEEGEGQ